MKTWRNSLRSLGKFLRNSRKYSQKTSTTIPGELLEKCPENFWRNPRNTFGGVYGELLQSFQLNSWRNSRGIPVKLKKKTSINSWINFRRTPGEIVKEMLVWNCPENLEEYTSNSWKNLEDLLKEFSVKTPGEIAENLLGKILGNSCRNFRETLAAIPQFL